MKFKAIDHYSESAFSQLVTELMAEGWILVRSGCASRSPDNPVHWAHMVMYEEGDEIE